MSVTHSELRAISAFNRVPDFARGQAHDLRWRWGAAGDRATLRDGFAGATCPRGADYLKIADAIELLSAEHVRAIMPKSPASRDRRGASISVSMTSTARAMR